jgi:hypothetical protein
MPIDDESGEFISPQKTYLDEVEIYDAELGGVVPAWKSLIYHGAKARQFAQLRADSAADIDEQAGVKQPPPLVADAVAQTEADIAKRIIDLINALNRRMDALEERADEQERQTKAAAALQLAEDIADAAPNALLSALADRITPDRRLH